MPYQDPTTRERHDRAIPLDASQGGPTQPVPEPSDLGPTRRRLSRERVLAAALALADEHGLESLSMRRLGQSLGVEAMSLYRHVANKDAILDALVETVLAEIALPAAGEPWQAAMRRRAHSALEVLQRHGWAISLLESRGQAGPAAMRYYDAILGCLRSQGFSLRLAAHAFAALDSYIYGFALQYVKLPFEHGTDRRAEQLAEIGQAILTQMPEGEFEHFREMITDQALQPGYDFTAEFEWGLELLLEGLQRRVAGEAGA